MFFDAAFGTATSDLHERLVDCLPQCRGGLTRSRTTRNLVAPS